MSVGLGVAFGLAGLLSATLAVTRASAARTLLWLLVSLLALAGAFFALTATFAAVLQILVYAGAVVAVFVFVLITVDVSPAALARERDRLRRDWLLPAAVALLVVLPLLIGPGAAGLPGSASLPDAPATAGQGPGIPPLSPKAVGMLLFGPWAVAVEVTSFLLLAGLLAVRHFGRRPPADGATTPAPPPAGPEGGDT